MSQAFEARLRPLQALGRRDRLRQVIVDIAELLYLSDSLYRYGRLEIASAPYEKPDRYTLEQKIYSFHRYRSEVDMRPLRIRMDHAFDRKFGRRPEAIGTANEDGPDIFEDEE